MRAVLRRMWELWREFAREISDESAYARYLRVSGEMHSRAAWRAFSSERYARKYRNGKCC